ncbi:acetamidase [Alternaria alternata]|uniref:amidase n=2 Tax=Alternaria alternata complex TaxID=187734 RepID=A0A177DB74_ALTAL|nr:acetamidase [Alternaria alternata]RII16456.1 acetamidase [Alternaria sp. MG1]RYN49984.1 Acetamidase [Alternaria tenuissima]KAH6862570.1 acetamidase [Alternaria alternata]OAG17033.1 acetamidase [Alternaria alternata]OWY42569.1 acetamidase [Alternaria alternata]
MTSSWEELAADKRTRIASTIPSEWLIRDLPSDDNVFEFPKASGLLSAREIELTESSATDLVAQMAEGKLKSVDVTLAFCKRAALAQQLTNCVHEFFPEEALAQARDLDKYYAEHNTTVGPLHGLPISLKDQLRVKGKETSMGYVSWLGKYDEKDSVLTELLRKAGAVFYVKTSVPQTLMVCETVNNIIGRTTNPRNKNWSCGGSSGGEGAMIGLRGGIIGVGTDIGGSIRIPSAFNFLYGIRPSHGRMPYANMANSMEGQETIHSVVGPIAHSASDLRLFLTSVLREEPWNYDSKVIPLPWRYNLEDALKAKLNSSGLTIGYYTCDGNVLPHPPVLRGIERVMDVLERSQHKVLPWTPYKHDFAVDLANKIYGADGSTDVMKDINASGEPGIPNIKELLNPDMRKADLNDVWDIHLQKWDYQMQYLSRWREVEAEHGCELDCIVAPISPTAAIRHNQFKYYGYASAINLLDFTSVVVPVTFADSKIDAKRADYEPLNDMDAAVQAEYDPEAYHGAPVAIQVIGKRLSEEKTLAIAEEIGRLLGNSVTP